MIFDYFLFAFIIYHFSRVSFAGMLCAMCHSWGCSFIVLDGLTKTAFSPIQIIYHRSRHRHCHCHPQQHHQATTVTLCTAYPSVCIQMGGKPLIFSTQIYPYYFYGYMVIVIKRLAILVCRHMYMHVCMLLYDYKADI